MSKALSLTSKISEAGNAFIISKLKEYNYGNLAPSHGDILVVLYKYKKITMKNIAEKIGRTKATVTVLIDKLEKNGLVKREKASDDNRITYISLSEKGLEFKPIFEIISNDLNTMLYKNFTEDEAKQLDYLLEKMLKNV